MRSSSLTFLLRVMLTGLCNKASILFIITLHLPRGMFNSSSLFVATQGLDRYALSSDYDKNEPPAAKTQVNVSLFIHRVSAVDESKEEISLEVFLQVYWVDDRITIVAMGGNHIELNWEKEQKIWVPDLYIRQLRDMKVLALFQEMTFVRLYQNKTLRVSMGATIQIKCDMDFDLYPLDVQKCFVDFSSYKYTAEAMEFHWAYGKSSLSFPSDFGNDGYRLPKYVVTFEAQNGTHCVFYGEGNHSTARMLITMSREIRSHLLESYLPSTLFVIMSWGSFVVMPEVVPGRMVLLVTTLLSLVTMFDTIRNNSPSALELKCIEVWLISCTLFVFFALLEYFIVLFGIRYDKHWRHKNGDLDINGRALEAARNSELAKERLRGLFSTQRVIPQSPLAPKAEPESMVIENHYNSISKEPTPTVERGPASLPPQTPGSPVLRENHVNQVNHLNSIAAAKEQSPTAVEVGAAAVQREQPTPQPPDSLRPLTQQTTLASATSHHALRIEGGDTSPNVIRAPRSEAMTGKQKFRMLTQHVILYAGSQRGTIDQVSLALFPFCFSLFAVIYWISYLTESRRRANE